MKALEKSLRNQLENTVKEAREICEVGAKIALDQLAVGEPLPLVHLNEDERQLRRRLRIHGRQLGDVLNENKTQSTERLVEEIAYEHWHRMLFARFLSENNLLMYPDKDNPVPVNLEECKDLAAKEGARDGWELAANFAARMLPQIFRLDSPVFQLSLSPEYKKKLEQIIDALPSEIFTASDSLGWVYQFWQSKKKDEINASEVKIGAQELAAVTQLFTEPYMVNFLLDNTIGAWWAANKLTKNDLKIAKNEEELRRKVSLPGMPLEYLRFFKGEDDSWHLASGTFGSWPKQLKDFKFIDPCCGSGHFLVTAFLMLVSIRMQQESLSARDSCDVVLRENIHGLEIDRRCVELSAFALALTAWKFPDSGGYRKLPAFEIAWCGQSVTMNKKNWVELAGIDNDLKFHLNWLFNLFQDASLLGSLLNPKISYEKGNLFSDDWDKIVDIFRRKLVIKESKEENDFSIVVGGMEKAFQLLSGKYQLVLTNVPYLGAGKQSEKLFQYCKKNYEVAANDLATVFLIRCLEYCSKTGYVATVLPQNWLFLTSYKKLRKNFLLENTLKSIVWLGPGAFDSISGEVVKPVLFIAQKKYPMKNSCFTGIDISQSSGAKRKELTLKENFISIFSQQTQLQNPKSIISLGKISKERILSRYLTTHKGICTGDSLRFTQYFWEQPLITNGWVHFRTSVNNTLMFSGMEKILYWQDGRGELVDFVSERLGGNISAWIRGQSAWGKRGVSVSRVSGLSATVYSGELFNDNAATLIPIAQEDLASIWCYCSSDHFEEDIRKINRKLSVDNEYLKLISIDIKNWRKIAVEIFPNGLPKQYSEDPMQWIFHGHPAKSDEPLHVAVVRLLGYRWPAEVDSTMELSEESRLLIKNAESLLPFSDEDGIVCIPSVRGEQKAEDRLEKLLAAAYGVQWSYNKKIDLLDQVGYKGKTLETWLREKFFVQHCKLFHDRPFIWQIWDGLNDGFAALVNYHKFDTKKLETLVYTYLGDWISRQKKNIVNGVEGAEEKLAAAEGLKKRLELILEGEAPYDVFVRWKPTEEQPIGWNPDLNDGVRLNIRPFMCVPDLGKKGAGVLRHKPNIKWNKDRGKDVESAPWFKLGPLFGGREGDRINNHHLSLAEKNLLKKSRKLGR